MHLTFESELPVSVINSAKLKHNIFLIWTVWVFQEVFSFAITCCLLYVLFSPIPPCRSRWRKRDSTQLSLKNKQSLFCRYFIETDHENWHKKNTTKLVNSSKRTITGLGQFRLELDHIYFPFYQVILLLELRKIVKYSFKVESNCFLLSCRAGWQYWALI